MAHQALRPWPALPAYLSVPCAGHPAWSHNKLPGLWAVSYRRWQWSRRFCTADTPIGRSRQTLRPWRRTWVHTATSWTFPDQCWFVWERQCSSWRPECGSIVLRNSASWQTDCHPVPRYASAVSRWVVLFRTACPSAKYKNKIKMSIHGSTLSYPATVSFSYPLPLQRCTEQNGHSAVYSSGLASILQPCFVRSSVCLLHLVERDVTSLFMSGFPASLRNKQVACKHLSSYLIQIGHQTWRFALRSKSVALKMLLQRHDLNSDALVLGVCVSLEGCQLVDYSFFFLARCLPWTRLGTYCGRCAHFETLNLWYFVIWGMPEKECRLPFFKLNFCGCLQDRLPIVLYFF